MYASPPPLFSSTHSHTQYSQALLHLTWEGLHRRTCSAPPWHFNRPFIGGPFQNQTAMCSLCARELSNRRKESEGGGLNEDSSSFSFFLPQPAFDLAVCPPLNTQAAVWEGRVKLLLVSHSIRLCSKYCKCQVDFPAIPFSLPAEPQSATHCTGSALHVGLQL